jgi:hypothetical protein
MRCRHPVLTLLSPIVLSVLISGCSVRSISDSGYPAAHARNPFYRGELTEFDVLGEAEASDIEIARILETHRRISLVKGSSILLVQSGAPLPDDGMLRAMSTRFAVTPFSGVPPDHPPLDPQREDQRGAYLRMLRTAAARSGSTAIVCYWGVIEAANENEATKAISWIPIVGSMVPDETEHLRIRLKMVVIDVATGDWAALAPAALSDAALSAGVNRAGVDQAEVASLKDKAYQQAADEVTRVYSP